MFTTLSGSKVILNSSGISTVGNAFTTALSSLVNILIQFAPYLVGMAVAFFVFRRLEKKTLLRKTETKKTNFGGMNKLVPNFIGEKEDYYTNNQRNKIDNQTKAYFDSKNGNFGTGKRGSVDLSKPIPGFIDISDQIEQTNKKMRNMSKEEREIANNEWRMT